MTLTRSRSQAISQLHPNKEIASALHSILSLLEQHQLQWHDIGRNPDCQFTSFIHASEEKVPEQEQIIQVRRAVRNWLLAHQLSLLDTVSEWRNRVMAFGFATELRKQGNEHSLCAMAACFTTRINLITVSTSGHHVQEYCPPDNIQPTKEIWLLYMHFEHTRHYLSTTKIQNRAPTLPPLSTPSMRGANGSVSGNRRSTSSTDLPNDHTPAVRSSSRVAVSVPAAPNPIVSQEASQVPQPIIEDIFEHIQHVQGDFVDCLIQNGALKFLQQIYKDGTLWTPRDCRIQRTPPSQGIH